MLASELRANARKILEGKWGKGALIVLCYMLIMWGINLVLGLIPIIGMIANFIISVPISYGIVVSFIKLKRGEEVKYTGFLTEGFSKFGKVWGVYGHTILKVLIPLILYIVFNIILFCSRRAMIFNLLSGSKSTLLTVLSLVSNVGTIACVVYIGVKGLLYSLVNFILYDNPSMKSKEIVEESERLMNGKRCKYIWLCLTFIGWIILCCLTLGIGLLWLVPYAVISSICFYEDLADKSIKQEEIDDENNNPISE